MSKLPKFSSYRNPGRFQVEQLVGKEIIRRDFDAEEWSYNWAIKNGISVLRLLRDSDPEMPDFFEFVEFSLPIIITYVPEQIIVSNLAV